MHYYKFNIGDYASHTTHLSIQEDLAYRRMIDWVYLHESALPADVNQIARLIRMRKNIDSISVVLEEFFELGDYGYFQSKAMKEIREYQSKSEKAKASAAARWNKRDANALKTQSERNANGMRVISECNANHKPLTNNQKTTHQGREITDLINFDEPENRGR